MPRLPGALARLAFGVRCRGRRLRIEVEPDHATYTLREGEATEITHHGESVTLEPGRPVTCPIPRPPVLEPPVQPAGRAPVRRGVMQ
jgi:alpha,alpha-trehalose phosphorylase